MCLQLYSSVLVFCYRRVRENFVRVRKRGEEKKTSLPQKTLRQLWSHVYDVQSM